MYIVGIDPGTVYTEADLLAGKIAFNGARGLTVDSTFGTREFLSCKLTGGNVTTGMVVNISSAFACTIISAGGAAKAGREGIGLVGVAVVTATASTSASIWVQIWGKCNVIASTSCTPNVALAPASVATGGVDDTVASASAVFDGIVTLASTNATTTIVSAFLNYPHWTSLA